MTLSACDQPRLGLLQNDLFSVPPTAPSILLRGIPTANRKHYSSLLISRFINDCWHRLLHVEELEALMCRCVEFIYNKIPLVFMYFGFNVSVHLGLALIKIAANALSRLILEPFASRLGTHWPRSPEK